MRIESYYDIGCTCCGAHRSTDFSKGMPFTKKGLDKTALEEGWLYSKLKNANFCPNCVKKAYDKASSTVFVGYNRGDIEDECRSRGIKIVSNRSVMERKLIAAMTMELLEAVKI